MTDVQSEGTAVAETNATAAEPDGKATEAVGAESAPAAAETGESSGRKIQERFDKLTREKYDALREADYWRAQAQRQPAEPKPVAPAEPTLEQYNFDEAKYRAAVIEYAKAQAREEAKAALQEFKETTEAETLQGAFEKRQIEFMASKPDYAEKVFNPRLPISDDMARAIALSDIGPQIAYYLAEHEDQAHSIVRMDPIAQAREIGRIEARLESEVSKPAAKPVVSKAPPPTPKLDASNEAVEKEPKEMTAKEFREWRKRQIAQRRRY